MESKFWMVLRDGSNYTSFRHKSKFKAVQEASRLAQETGGKFYVLETIAILETEKPKVTVIKWNVDREQDEQGDEWHPASERPTMSKNCNVEEGRYSVHVMCMDKHGNTAIGWYCEPCNSFHSVGIEPVKWRYLNKQERAGRDWKGEPWPDDGGEG